MLQIRNISSLLALTLIFVGGTTSLQADSVRPSQVAANKAVVAKNVSLSTSSDCCETAQAPAPAPTCKTYKPCVTYRGCWDCCGPKASHTLNVKDPCDCCCNPCYAEIPVCLPACCKNPCVSCKCGLFGRGIVTYSFDCGCCVTIVFRNCGEVIVKYSG